MPDTDFLAGPVGCDSRQRKTLHHRAGAKFERREAVQRKEEERKGVGLVQTRRPLKGRSLSGATGPQRPRVDSRWGQDNQVSDAINKKALQAAIIPRL